MIHVGSGVAKRLKGKIALVIVAHILKRSSDGRTEQIEGSKEFKSQFSAARHHRHLYPVSVTLRMTSAAKTLHYTALRKASAFLHTKTLIKCPEKKY